MDKQLAWLESETPLTTDRLLETQAAVNPLGVTIGMTNPNRIVAEHGKLYVLEKGVSSLFTSQVVEEQILTKAPATARQPLFEVIKKFLAQLAPSKSITVIDPYFFAAQNVLTYPAIVANVLGPVVTSVAKITFVRDSSKDVAGLPAAVHAALQSLNPSLNISDHTTTDFHDRFWIIDGTRGLVLGTSLNGVGARICLVDYLDKSDVADIVQELASQGIVV